MIALFIVAVVAPFIGDLCIAALLLITAIRDKR